MSAIGKFIPKSGAECRIETLKTVERLVIGPFGLHQQTVLGQYPKQSVPPDRQPSIVLALQQIMLLVDAHP